jgi:hypothetical protein
VNAQKGWFFAEKWGFLKKSCPCIAGRLAVFFRLARFFLLSPFIHLWKRTLT